MKKNTIRSAIVLAILFILYNVIVFVAPFYHGAVFWVGYVFTVIAFAVSGVAVYIGFIKQPDVKSKFYGFPIVKISAVFLAIQIISGIVFTLLGKVIPVWIPVILYAVLLGAAVIGLISVDAVVDEIRVQDQKLKKDVSMMRSLQSQVNQMVSQCNNAEAEKAVKKFAEELKYSDPVSSDAISEAEKDLEAVILELQCAVVEEDYPTVRELSRKGSALLAERNRLCKLNK